MPSRMDKYNNENVEEINTTRSQKNEQLYKDIYTNRRYTEIDNIDGNNIVDITNSFNKPTRSSRSDFQKKRVLYEDGFVNDDYFSKDVDEKKYSEIEKNKSYNVNEILEQAKKERSFESEEEKQRKIRNVEYSILSDLSQEKLKEYQERKEKPLSEAEEENLEDLIHTITSNSMRKKIDDGLLTDLMPETEEEPVVSEEFLDSLDLIKNDDELFTIEEETKNEKEEDNEKELTLETTLDKSFFTKSMDLNKDDIVSKEELEEEIDESFEEDKLPAWKVALVIVLITAILGLIAYVILRFV